MQQLPFSERFKNQQAAHTTNLELAQDMLGMVDRFIVCVLTLEAYLVDTPAHCALPMVSDFCNSVEEALHRLALAIRESQPLNGFPDLQEALRRLQNRKSGSMVQDTCRDDLRFVIAEAKRMVEILNGMREMVGGEKED